MKAVAEASARKAKEVKLPEGRPEKYFGELVFDTRKMFEYLPKATYDSLVKAIEEKQPITRDVADSVAEGMRRWAIDNGARHYTHWFHPLTGGTAEKHDSFIDYDGKGGVIEKFSGKLLVQQEPDASSFPNGGIRNTFEARGYSAWDISSPAFILGETLCIPTVFISYTGESLDYKTPLLRSLNAVDKAATKVARLFDPRVKHVKSYLGWEQEYFLVDEALYGNRPDLMLTGRTLLGHESAKNQQLEDHYFGAIPARVEAFMLDLELKCHRLGIPAKTRHNEVAPNQFELAPIFEETNLANDHNLLLMKLMEETAREHNFRVLFHEKPFAGINGSGKHNNWSLGTDTGTMLFSPGKTPQENLQFLSFVSCVMAAVWRYNSLLKASIMSATNEHRLGGNEAPPAIISIFTGSQLAKVLDYIENADTSEMLEFSGKEGRDLHLSQIPELMIDNTDRNRTSPFAFTGNRFEFRAVGSSANNAAAMLALNAAVADVLNEFAYKVAEFTSQGMPMEKAILEETKALIREAKPVHFDGNGYSEEWFEEARRRGLDCETSAPLIFDAYCRQNAIDMFTRTGVLTEVELRARNEVKWDLYIKKVQIEARVIGDLAVNHIAPVASRYRAFLAESATAVKQLFGAEKALHLIADDLRIIEEISSHLDSLQRETRELIEERKVANRIDDVRLRAIAYHDKVEPRMEEIRRHADKLELLVDDEMWPLAKYRELLFIK